jgi:hypothetical protein
LPLFLDFSQITLSAVHEIRDLDNRAFQISRIIPMDFPIHFFSVISEISLPKAPPLLRAEGEVF